MTNGEKMKEIFPYLENDETDLVKVLNIDNLKGWWNAEYKEPTTKNCESCEYYGSHHEVCNYCYKCSLWTEQELTTKNDLAHNLCDSCTNIGCEFQSGIVRTECAFYTPPHIEPDNCGNYVNHLVPINVVERIIKSPRTKEQMLSVLNLLPPQEPRIITCKECKYYRNKGNKYSYCTKRLNVDSVTDRYREPNFYCADAVLREVEE